jgi:hypothetical protein
MRDVIHVFSSANIVSIVKMKDAMGWYGRIEKYFQDFYEETRSKRLL